MEERKNLCALIPIELHNQVTEAREQLGQTTSEYITNLISEYFKLIENGATTAELAYWLGHLCSDTAAKYYAEVRKMKLDINMSLGI